MKDKNKQNDELIMSKEHWALIKFKELPNLDENKNITSEDCYNPTLYRYDECWVVDWVSDEGDSILTFEDDDIYNVINKAHDWFNNKFRMFDSM